jgi:hypothetical protein
MGDLPDESETDVLPRLQTRFLELVVKQFPETNEVRCLFCPVCGSKNLSAQIEHELQFDQRLFLEVRRLRMAAAGAGGSWMAGPDCFGA